MRWAPLVVVTMLAGSARAATDCQAEGDVRSQAECIHDALAPDVITKLYRLALSTVRGRLDTRNPPADFLYIAEEAGEAARRKDPKPLVEMAASDDPSSLVFAARAITTFLAAAQDGTSHRYRFAGKGDARVFADAKPTLRAPCKRLAAHADGFLRAEGERCLGELDQPRLPPLSGRLGDDLGPPVTGVDVASGRGGLRAAGSVGLPMPEAAGSYRDRCDKGDGKGCHLFADLNRFERFGPGRTYPQNLPRAVELYQRGCDLGFAMSCAELAGMLRAGKGVPRDAARAAALDRRACKLNHRPSCPK
jgi:hypothetical protein